MQNRIFILLGVLFANVASHYVFAQQSEPDYVAPTSVHDTLIVSDSIMVIHTVCAPICSSHVRVYNKEWLLIGELQPPFRSAFPEAYIENGKLLWRDNDNFDYTPCL